MLCLSWTGCLMVRTFENVPLKASPTALNKGFTQQQVLTLFGPPTKYIQNPQGVLFIYSHKGRHLNEFFIGAPRGIASGRFTLFDLYYNTQKEDQLLILFDPEGTVVDFAYHQGTDELRTFF